MHLRICLVVMVSGLSQTTFAGSIRCQGHLFQDDQVHPVLMSEVLDKCGEPKRREGNVLVYDQSGGVQSRLHFNDAGELENVEEMEGQ